ncbi:MAG TPA: hypothetical protein VFO95_16375 [Gemmatimonadales bacterium]|nr:hypothetical protein [Gemmatimonadales bacterium]
MNPRLRAVALGLMTIVAVGCSRPGPEAAGGAGDAGGASPPTVVDRAAAVAHAIQADTAAADSILAAHGLTRAGLDSLMYEIAADSALARAYAEAIR